MAPRNRKANAAEDDASSAAATPEKQARQASSKPKRNQKQQRSNAYSYVFAASVAALVIAGAFAYLHSSQVKSGHSAVRSQRGVLSTILSCSWLTCGVGFRGSSGNCVCLGGGNPLAFGFCRNNKNGMCTVFKQWSWSTRTWYCPPDSQGNTNDGCTGPTPDPSCAGNQYNDGCVYGVKDTTNPNNCMCMGAANPSVPGYCHDSLGACTIVKTWNGTAFVCPSNTNDGCTSSSTNPTCLNPQLADCVYGTRVNGVCQCTNQNVPAQPGYCTDSSGFCTVVKTWDPTTSSFVCPAGSGSGSGPSPSSGGSPSPGSGGSPSPGSGGAGTGSPAGCSWGIWNSTAGQCTCLGEYYPKNPGYCRDSTGACTIIKVWDGTNYYCPSTSGATVFPNDCLYGTLNNGGCVCYNAGNPEYNGFCRDGNGRCTIPKNADVNAPVNARYSCPAGTDDGAQFINGNYNPNNTLIGGGSGPGGAGGSSANANGGASSTMGSAPTQTAADAGNAGFATTVSVVTMFAAALATVLAAFLF